MGIHNLSPSRLSHSGILGKKKKEKKKKSWNPSGNMIGEIEAFNIFIKSRPESVGMLTAPIQAAHINT